MTIPVDAVYYENGEPYVYTYSDGKVWQKFIEEGIFDSDILEVKSGLSMDDMVVTTWSSELYEGSQVQKADANAAASTDSESNAQGEAADNAETTENAESTEAAAETNGN